MNNKKAFGLSIKYFLSWRIILILVAAVGVFILPKWGGWYAYADRSLTITGLPSWLWSWGGFDGVHYLRLAQGGYFYKGSQAFFPVYPVLIDLLSRIIPVKNYLDPAVFVNTNFFYAGMIISNVAAFLSVFFLLKFFTMEFGEKTAQKTVIFLLAFPTAFYMGALYTESIFILFAVLTLYFYKKEKFIPAALFGFLTSATRVVGIFIPFIMVVDSMIKLKRSRKNHIAVKALTAGIVGGSGLLAYMVFLQVKFSDFLMFLHVQGGFGAERSSGALILLPQVFYRYLKIFISLGPTQMRFYNALFELVFTCLALYFLVVSFRKIKLSYWLAALGILILPTLTGTLSSMPRYILSMFIIFPFIVLKLKKGYWPVIVLFVLLQAACVILFTRGYWVA